MRDSLCLTLSIKALKVVFLPGSRVMYTKWVKTERYETRY
ncbi:hypothetical protein SAMN04488067_104263 [Halorubrum xinjiangense]|uniref:Uncharacterized protein n=1 Tax=Halorubrum xinjiangense TaxID=261291 RepID=A0A1G7L951_9EURY|nr:hypothetical protein SAMN04488067_104263 [Halorubrum xinjiangense]